MSAEGSSKAVVAAFAANLGIAIAKFTAFVFTGSASMLAEGIHSVADTSNQALLLLGRRQSRKVATPEHPFGFGQESYFWAFLVAVVLFTLGAAFSLFEGFEKLRHPHEIESLGWAVGVLLMAMVFEAAALRTAMRAAAPHRTGSWWRYVRETRAPENAVVLLEDTAAEIGLLAALSGVTLAAVTGDPRYDAAGTLVIGAVLAVVAVVLAREMRSLLIGESADPSDIQAIRGVMTGLPVVERIVDLRTMHLGPSDILVAARVELARDLGVDDAAECIDQIAAAIRDAVPAAKRVYIEPDLDASTGAPTR